MKMSTRRLIRKWTGLFLALCIFGCVLPVSTLADTTFQGIYTGGITDNSHDADHNPLGNLTLCDPIDPEDGNKEHAALILDFPEGYGGGEVTLKTGDLTADTEPAARKAEFGDPHYPEDWDAGEMDVIYEPHALVIHMDDQSTLHLETGNMTDTSGSAALITITNQSDLNLKTGDIEAKDGSVFIPYPVEDSEEDDENEVCNTSDVIPNNMDW